MTRGLGGQSPSNVAQHLKGIDFPCRKKDLINHARKNQAGDSILKALDAFPEQEYSSMADVFKGIGQEK